MIGIYKIINPKGKVYIGQSNNIEHRWEMYGRLACKKQAKLYNSLVKYGWENHKKEIIEECNSDQLNKREIYWGEKFNVLNKNGLNLKLGNGRGVCSEETKQKMKISATGREWKDETKIKFKLSKTNHPMYNDDWRNKIREANKGRKILWADKISNASKGKEGKFTNKSHSIETKQKMSEYRKEKYINSHKYKPILQYDLEGNLIKEWRSIAEAKEEFKGDISACVRGKQKTAYGFKWKYRN